MDMSTGTMLTGKMAPIEAETIRFAATGMYGQLTAALDWLTCMGQVDCSTSLFSSRIVGIELYGWRLDSDYLSALVAVAPEWAAGIVAIRYYSTVRTHESIRAYWADAAAIGELMS